ncbi:MAG: hydantoinase B/oxoprolinase family protein [Proteobacteria bacterium]|nr:hydantoinase B/oxoprolinase family protein [Pseudomonadota bacterium]
MTGVSDPFGLELFKSAIFSLADEMALTILRTTYSGVLKDNMDYSTGLCDADGNLIAQGLTIPMHLGAMPTALAAVLARFGNDIRDGDVYILNDPYAGGMHLPDLFLFKPVYANGERIAFAATVCHHTDMGGRVAGSNAADSTEIYQEGLRIPPLRYYEAGVRNEPVHRIIEKNVRVPVRVFGDIRAQLAACHTAEAALAELVGRLGAGAVRACMAEVIAYSERYARSAIRGLPDGVFAFEDWIDDDGVEFGRPIRLKVTFTKQGERLAADWSGSAAQVRGAINSTLSCTKAAVYCAVKCVLAGDIPANEGFFRTIEVAAPEGSIVNPVLPAATAARALTTFRLVDTCFGALSRMCPERVYAASDGGNVGVAVGGYYPDRSPFIYVDFACGAWGGRPFADGLEGNTSIFANISSSSVEITEVEHPLQFLAYEFLPDRGGAGRFRGGAPFRRDYRLTADEAVLQIRNDRHMFAPYGLCGGKPGGRSRNILNPGLKGGAEMTAKVTRTIRKGDVFRYEMAGAGGWGDPLEREPEKVLRDVRNGFVSAAAARADYGVVIRGGARPAVDESATAAERKRLRRARGRRGLPFVDRGELPRGARG